MMGLWTLLLLLLPLVEGCSLPAPLNMSIVSVNLEHTLTWLPGRDTPVTAHFRVHSLDLRTNSWKPVKSCTRLKADQTCGLTKVFKDPFGDYCVRVQAFTHGHTSNWTTSTSFQPLTDTMVAPPGVSVSGGGNSLLLQLSPPEDEGRQWSPAKLYYRDFICQFSLLIASTEDTVIGYLEPGAEYCVTVTVSVTFNPNTIPSQPHCTFTSPPRTSTVPVVLCVLCAFGLLVALSVGVVVYTAPVLCLRKPLPRSLSSIPRFNQRSVKAQQLFSLVSVLPQGSCDWVWTPRHQHMQKTGQAEEEEEDEGYGLVVLSDSRLGYSPQWTGGD